MTYKRIHQIHLSAGKKNPIVSYLKFLLMYYHAKDAFIDYSVSEPTDAYPQSVEQWFGDFKPEVHDNAESHRFGDDTILAKIKWSLDWDV